MKMTIYQNAANQTKEENNGQTSQRGLWSAVLLQALEDWQSTNVRRKKEAEKFFFESGADFSRVCRAAGLVPESVLSKLRSMNVATIQPACRLQQAA
jgi:hypothetical protein